MVGGRGHWFGICVRRRRVALPLPSLRLPTPITVDGVEIVGSVILFVDRLTHRKPRALAWACVLVGTIISVAANMLVAADDWVSRFVSAWPAFALLLAMKLLLAFLEDPPSDCRQSGKRPADTPVADTDDHGPTKDKGPGLLLPETPAARARWGPSLSQP